MSTWKARSGTDKRDLWRSPGFQSRTAEDRKAYRATVWAFQAALAEAEQTGGLDARIALKGRHSAYLREMEAAGNRTASFPSFAEWDASRSVSQ